MIDENSAAEIAAQETAAAAEERLLAGKYKSVEELERAYVEVRDFESRRNEEINQLRRIAEKVETLEEQLVAPQRARETQAFEQSIIEALDSDDPYERMRAQAWLTEEVVNAKLQALQPQRPQVDPNLAAFVADQQMSARYGDWNDVKAEVAGVIRERPHLFPINESSTVDEIVSGLDTVYEIARARHVLRSGSTAAADAAAAARAAKEAAQTMQGTSSRPATMTPEQEKWAAIKAAKVGLFS
jgi:hypothetical protein